MSVKLRKIDADANEFRWYEIRLLEGDTFVYEWPRSVLIIGWDQTYRGRSILVLKKHLPDFFRVSHQESLGLLSDIKSSERALHTAFSPDMMNYLFMGNVAQHAHLHLVPRYVDDPNYGSSPFLDTRRVRKPSLPDDEYRNLAKRVRAGIFAWGDREPRIGQ